MLNTQKKKIYPASNEDLNPKYKVQHIKYIKHNILSMAHEGPSKQKSEP
jgi:hypothetical protein